MKLLWKPNFSASALHAIFAVAHHLPCVEARVPESLGEISRSMQAFVQALPELARRRFWNELIGLASELDGNRDLAERVLIRLVGQDANTKGLIAPLAGWITDVEATMQLLFPKMAEQLELRSRPLKEIWEGYGHGLLAHIGRLTDRSLLVEQAEVVMVHPILGGYGMAHLTQNRITMEAMLTNPLATLPEVIRLAWLLAQLQIDAPYLSENVSQHRLSEVAGLAMLPAVLAAGQVVELTKIDEATMSLAIEQWQIPVPPKIDPVAVLMTWWETYLQTRPAWPVALTALDRMLET